MRALVSPHPCQPWSLLCVVDYNHPSICGSGSQGGFDGISLMTDDAELVGHLYIFREMST